MLLCDENNITEDIFNRCTAVIGSGPSLPISFPLLCIYHHHDDFVLAYSPHYVQQLTNTPLFT